MTTFVDFHILQTLPPSCVNRDDTGSPKSASYGGVKRARISSQAWKRAARSEFTKFLNASKLGHRTFYVVELIVAAVEAENSDYSAEQISEAACKVLKTAGIKTSPAKSKKNDDGEEVAASAYPVTSYLLFISPIQLEALSKLTVSVLEGDKPSKKDAQAAIHELNSVDIALFGRMIADDPSLNSDASCQVSHALGVSASANEFDYFTASDDLQRADNAGAGMIGTVEFVSATFYRYATINVDALVANLGSKEAAIEAIRAFVPAFSLSMPTGKQNTFANRTRPNLVVAQIRDDQPVNLVEAFETPIASTTGTIEEATERLVTTSVEQDSAFSSTPVATFYLATGGASQGAAQEALSQWGESQKLDDLVSSVAETISPRIEV